MVVDLFAKILKLILCSVSKTYHLKPSLMTFSLQLIKGANKTLEGKMKKTLNITFQCLI